MYSLDSMYQYSKWLLLNNFVILSQEHYYVMFILHVQMFSEY